MQDLGCARGDVSELRLQTLEHAEVQPNSCTGVPILLVVELDLSFLSNLAHFQMTRRQCYVALFILLVIPCSDRSFIPRRRRLVSPLLISSQLITPLVTGINFSYSPIP